MNDRPFVLVNTAMSADGKTDTVDREGFQIASAANDILVDRLRADSDAVMVGGHTLVTTDPRLTVRSMELVVARHKLGMEPQPVKVGVVSSIPDDRSGLGIGDQSRFLHDGLGRVVLFTTERTDAATLARLRANGAEVIIAGERRVDLPAALNRLFRAGIRRLMVEGGGTLVAALLSENLVDELRLYVAPIIFGGDNASTPVGGPGFTRASAIRLRLRDSERLDDGGIVLHYVVEPPTADYRRDPEATSS